MEMFWHWNIFPRQELDRRGLALEPGRPEAMQCVGHVPLAAEMDSDVARFESTRARSLNPYWVQRLARQLYLPGDIRSEAVFVSLIREIQRISNPR